MTYHGWLWLTAGIAAVVYVATLPVFWQINQRIAKRRAERGLCTRCCYDRSGLAADAACPECGYAEPPADPM
ncbi:MAG: hypothetical protein AAF747_06675 [Planctomycetota bacterium]